MSSLLDHNRISCFIDINLCSQIPDDGINFSTLDELHVEELMDYFNILELSRLREFSNEFIDKYIHNMHTSTVSTYLTLSDKIIDKYADILNWRNLCTYVNLSENIIDKHANKIYWNELSYYHRSMSKDFIIKYKEYLNVKMILSSPFVSDDIKKIILTF